MKKIKKNKAREEKMRNVEQKYIGSKDICIYLGISKVKLYELAKTGKIPALRVGNRYLFCKEDVEKSLAYLV